MCESFMDHLSMKMSSPEGPDARPPLHIPAAGGQFLDAFAQHMNRNILREQ